MIPDRRPDVTLADRDGKLRSLSEWDGRPQIINFWATWCAPCRREIPMLNELARDPALADFALIGIAIDFREDVLRFLAETPIEYTVLIGEQDGLDASAAFGMRLARPAVYGVHRPDRPDRDDPCRRVASFAGGRHPVRRPGTRRRRDRPADRPAANSSPDPKIG